MDCSAGWPRPRTLVTRSVQRASEAVRCSADSQDGTVQVRAADGSVDKIESVPDVPALAHVGTRVSQILSESAVE